MPGVTLRTPRGRAAPLPDGNWQTEDGKRSQFMAVPLAREPYLQLHGFRQLDDGTFTSELWALRVFKDLVVQAPLDRTIPLVDGSALASDGRRVRTHQLSRAEYIRQHGLRPAPNGGWYQVAPQEAPKEAPSKEALPQEAPQEAPQEVPAAEPAKLLASLEALEARYSRLEALYGELAARCAEAQTRRDELHQSCLALERKYSDLLRTEAPADP